MNKNTIIIILSVIAVAAIVFFVLGFLRKGPNPGNGPAPGGNQPNQTINNQQ